MFLCKCVCLVCVYVCYVRMWEGVGYVCGRCVRDVCVCEVYGVCMCGVCMCETCVCVCVGCVK